MGVKTTFFIAKADVGSMCGHTMPHPDQLQAVRDVLDRRENDLFKEYYAGYTGDDIAITIAHKLGSNCREIQELCLTALRTAGDVAEDLGLYAAKQDLIGDAGCGNLAGMGIQTVEMEIAERKGESIIGFYLDKTRAGALCLPLYLMFADPMYNSGLLSSVKIHKGYTFEVMDVKNPDGTSVINLSTPEDLYDLVTLIQNDGRFIIRRVWSRATGELMAVVSTTRLDMLAGRHIGKDDPVALVRVQGEGMATGDALMPFEITPLQAGWMRGSHNGPLTPVIANSPVSYRDGPPVVSALGFNSRDGVLVGPVDLFNDQMWDLVRNKSYEIARIVSRQGPFGPSGRLGVEDDEYAGVHDITADLLTKFGLVDN